MRLSRLKALAEEAAAAAEDAEASLGRDGVMLDRAARHLEPVRLGELDPVLVVAPDLAVADSEVEVPRRLLADPDALPAIGAGPR